MEQQRYLDTQLPLVIAPSNTTPHLQLPSQEQVCDSLSGYNNVPWASFNSLQSPPAIRLIPNTNITATSFPTLQSSQSRTLDTTVTTLHDQYGSSSQQRPLHDMLYSLASVLPQASLLQTPLLPLPRPPPPPPLPIQSSLPEPSSLPLPQLLPLLQPPFPPTLLSLQQSQLLPLLTLPVFLPPPLLSQVSVDHRVVAMSNPKIKVYT